MSETSPNEPSTPTPSTPTPAPAAAPTAALAFAAPIPAPASPPTPRLVTVNAVNWGHILDFTHLFRGFRLAINPAKLMLALLAIMMIYAAGRAFDFVWGPQTDRDAIQQYAAQEGGTPQPGIDWQARRERNLYELLADDDKLTTQDRDTLKSDPRAAHKTLKQYYEDQFAQSVKTTHEGLAAAGAPSLAGRSPAEIERQSNAMAAQLLLEHMTKLDDTVGHGIFDTFLHYETSQFDALVENTLTFVRLTPVRQADAAGGVAQTQAVSGGLLSRDPDRFWRSDTVAGCLANMTITAPRWLFAGSGPMQWRPDNADTWAGWLHMMSYRALYIASVLALALFSLILLAFTGAAISRLSALELAGIERAPLRDVFVFAAKRLWVFIKAPISPFVILLAIGLVMALAAMLGAIPYVGPVIIGLMLFVFLGIAFVLMLLSLGILGGFNLLYPTIAVEGADAFDAMSRSFAYAYSRPWRLVFYTITSLIYGVFTFLFVSFAVYLILLLTHTFAGWGMNLFGSHYGSFGQPALETLWPTPRFLQLVQPINWWAMSWPEFIGAILLHFWVFILITGIGAYVISYYFSSHTIIYLLLRRSVDGQNLREIYLEDNAK